MPNPRASLNYPLKILTDFNDFFHAALLPIPLNRIQAGQYTPSQPLA